MDEAIVDAPTAGPAQPQESQDPRAQRRRRPFGRDPNAPPSTADRAISEVGARPAVLLREGRYRRILAGADVLATVVALEIAVGLPGAGTVRWTSLLLIPAVVLAAKLLGLYDRDELVVRKTTLDDVPRIACLSMLVVLAVWMADDVFAADPLSRPSAFLLGVLLFAGVVGGRYAARGIARRVWPPERCLLIGAAGGEARLRRVIETRAPAELVAQISLHDAHLGLNGDAGAEAMHRLIAEHDVHRVILEPAGGEGERETLDVVRSVKQLGVRVSVLPSVLDVVGAAVELDDLGPTTLLGLHRFGLTRSSAFVKRGFDVIVAGVVLVVAAPLLAVIALVVKLDSRGPVFFHQLRVGKDGRVFRIAKFRTMVAGAEAQRVGLAELNEADGLFKIANDPRITRAGRVLRRTGLDELPQLVNVLAGEMSLVGPRPLVVDEDEKVLGMDRERLALTPGMTGPWQIAGSSRVPLEDMLKLDYRYAATWSLWEDCKILLRTVPYVLARQGM